MRKSVCFTLLLAFCLFFHNSCIEKYEHEGIDEIENMWVIEGIIEDDISTIKISLSKKISHSMFVTEKWVTNALVYVECDDGSRSQAGEFKEETGYYHISNGTLDSGKKYRLYITADGKEYVSEFLSPLSTPEIDEITYGKTGPGYPVNIYVSTQDGMDRTRYYRWRYKEHWEVHAELFANAGYENVDGEKTLVYYDLTRNIYNCWGKDSIKTFQLGSTIQLSENRIRELKIHEIEPTDEKLSILYYIEVEQMKLREEAYTYFSLMQKNAEQTGGLFSIMPAQIRGNVTCLTDPEMVIIGYVEVTEIKKKELYIPRSPDLYEAVVSNCQSLIVPYTPSLPFYQYGNPTTCAPPNCVDCRTKPNATKEKPSFWPTNSR